jgi:hypothetical protein
MDFKGVQQSQTSSQCASERHTRQYDLVNSSVLSLPLKVASDDDDDISVMFRQRR